jgi:hypothetical protein
MATICGLHIRVTEPELSYNKVNCYLFGSPR